MAKQTTIEWCDHTFNHVIGCTKVAPGCEHCYAEADMDKRRGRVKWGPNGTRSRTSKAYWRGPLKWDKAAAAAGERRRVFCASLGDVFEDWTGPILDSHGQILYDVGDFNWRPESEINKRAFPGFDANDPLYQVTMKDVRDELFPLSDKTPNLDWLLLTKRPENILRMTPVNSVERAAHLWGKPGGVNAGLYRHNVWLGTSISDQATADKAIPELLKCRDLSPVLFLSAEPLLGPVDLAMCDPCDAVETIAEDPCYGVYPDGSTNHSPPGFMICNQRKHWRNICDFRVGACGIDWVIVGGESGPNARPCRPEWIRSIRDQCKSAGVPCFVKQLGANVITRNDMVEDEFNNSESGWPDPEVEHDIHGFREDYQGADCRIRLRDKKGGNITEWSKDLRVREFPEVAL